MKTDELGLGFADPRSKRSRGRCESDGIESVIERHVDEYWYYGAAKVALRDGLRAMLRAEGRCVAGARRAESAAPAPGTRSKPNVLLPAYLPDAVAEPIRELGLDPRYYAVAVDLRPDERDIRRRIDDETIALVSVDYFGFPQPRLATVAEIADEFACYHVDDNAHATLSVANGKLLGTFGDIGVSSLRKTLPIPNGAVLYVTNDALRARFEPSSIAGVSGRVTAADARFLAARCVRTLVERRGRLRRSVDALVGRRSHPPVPSPADRYEASKRPCSALSARVCARADPERIRRRRRQNYRAWLDALESVPRVTPLFPALPDGVCPQVMPVLTDRPRRVRSRLASNGLEDVHTWPRLPTEVATDPTYATAQYLAEHLLALPVDRRVDPERIVTAGAGLGPG